ncbi:MAG: SDR family oxidoreductase [Proteobacteria bacterium]|nr:SDR family oxidoreductase [Pseudomonadota bacterium]
MIFSLSGKNILVTGASSGIGRQIAIACSAMNARVILLGRNQERLDETLASLQDPALHLRYSADLLEYDKVESIIKDATGKTGKIHGVVNCAGISTTLPLRVINMNKMADLFHTNVFSAINLTKIVCKPAYIADDGASIIFISSVMSVVGEAGKTLYGMTKGALVAASKSLAIELAPRKIRVNCISPGVVVTPMSKSSFYSQNENTLNQIRSLHPLGLGRVEDIANPCVFLLSDEAGWITGTNLFVDGGYTAR